MYFTSVYGSGADGRGDSFRDVIGYCVSAYGKYRKLTEVSSFSFQVLCLFANAQDSVTVFRK
jgi:hypothetical protein